MVDTLVPDELWERIEPVLPVVSRRFRNPGRRRTPDRIALAGLVFILKTGIGFADLPKQVVGCSGFTGWRRMHEWIEAEVFDIVHERMLDHLRALDGLDLEKVAVDGSHVRAFKGANT